MTIKVTTYREDGTRFTQSVTDQQQANVLVRNAKKYGLRTKVYEHERKKRTPKSKTMSFYSPFGRNIMRGFGRL